jgi:RNA polymerase sigma-70 factor (ECF subfamily)
MQHLLAALRHYTRNMKVEGSYPNIHQVLIDLCKRGDSKAQFEIYKLYYKAMYNTCLRIVGDAAEAEDIMQESFFKAFDRINTYRNEVSFGAWLKRIVVNSSLDFLKKKKLQLTQIDEAYGLKDESLDDNDDFTPESVELLKRAIAQLPEGFKVVVNLFLIEGYSHDEVAEMLGITASTSRSQLARAKQRLLEILKTQRKTL